MIFMLLLPYLLRKSNSFSGFEAYHYLEGKDLVGKIITWLSSGYFNVYVWGKILPFVFGIACFVLFWYILKKLDFDLKTRVLGCIILILSSGFIYLHTTLNGYFIPVFINLLLFYFILYELEVVSLFLLFLLPFFGLIHFIVGVSIFSIYTIYKKKYIMSLVIFLVSILIVVFTPVNMLYSDGPFISDFGGRYGVSFFIGLLSLFGLKFLWNKKYEYWPIYASMLCFIVLALFDLRMLSYLNLILVGLAAIGFIKLYNNDWRSLTIKKFMILVFVCGLLFSGLSYANLLADDLPNDKIMEGLQFLGEGTYYDGIIFSYPSREYIIEFSGRKFAYAPGLFEERDFEKAQTLIQNYGISYIWIDNDIKSKVWVNEDEGFDFVLDYTTQNFKKIFVNEYVEVWEVVR